MLRKAILAILAVVAVAAVACCCMSSAVLKCFPRIIDTIAVANVGNNRTVSIYSDHCWWEVSRPLWYQAQNARKVVVPETLLGRDLGPQQYALKYVSAEDGALVGVFLVDPTKPDDYQFFVVVDFKANEWWPRSFPTIRGDTTEKQIVTEMIHRLELENPGMTKPGYASP